MKKVCIVSAPRSYTKVEISNLASISKWQTPTIKACKLNDLNYFSKRTIDDFRYWLIAIPESGPPIILWEVFDAPHEP